MLSHLPNLVRRLLHLPHPPAPDTLGARFLRLPPELRQHILLFVLDDLKRWALSSSISYPEQPSLSCISAFLQHVFPPYSAPLTATLPPPVRTPTPCPIQLPATLNHSPTPSTRDHVPLFRQHPLHRAISLASTHPSLHADMRPCLGKQIVTAASVELRHTQQRLRRRMRNLDRYSHGLRYAVMRARLRRSGAAAVNGVRRVDRVKELREKVREACGRLEERVEEVRGGLGLRGEVHGLFFYHPRIARARVLGRGREVGREGKREEKERVNREWRIDEWEETVKMVAAACEHVAASKRYVEYLEVKGNCRFEIVCERHGRLVCKGESEVGTAWQGFAGRYTQVCRRVRKMCS